MLAPWSMPAINRHEHRERPTRRRQTTIRHHVLVILTAAALLAFGALCPRLAPVRAETDDPPRTGQTHQPLTSTSRSDFIAEIHRTLWAQRNRRLQIADQLLAAPRGLLDRGDPRDQLTNQQITTMSAAANYENAKLTREIAEIAVIEYSEGIFVQDLETAKGEVKLAQSSVDWQHAYAGVLDERLARIERASDGSLGDLSIEFGWHDGIVDSQRRERKARLEVGKAESKVRMLSEYTKPIQLRELQAEVEKARAEELAKRAAYETEMAKEKRLEAAVAGENRVRRAPSHSTERVRSSLAEAIAVEQQIRAKLIEVATDAKLELPLERDIRGLAARLQATIEEAEFELSALKLDRLKPWIHRESGQADARIK